MVTIFIAALILGFVHGAMAHSLKHPIKWALKIGLAFGSLGGTICFLGSPGFSGACLFFVLCVTGSLIGAITPINQAIRRCFDL